MIKVCLDFQILFSSFLIKIKKPVELIIQLSNRQTQIKKQKVIWTPKTFFHMIGKTVYIFIRDMLGRQSYGRGRGSYRQSEYKAQTPEKGVQKSSFRGKRNVAFDPKEFMVAECSVHDIQIFKQVFDFLDDDYDGMLTPMDLRKAIRDYGGYKPGRPFVYVAMSVFDADDGGQITFKQFVKLMTQRPCEADTDEDIKRIFQNFDEQGKGYISEEDLMNAAQELGEEVTQKDIKDMISHCDPDGEGRISLQAFVQFNKRKNFD